MYTCSHEGFSLKFKCLIDGRFKWSMSEIPSGAAINILTV